RRVLFRSVEVGAVDQEIDLRVAVGDLTGVPVVDGHGAVVESALRAGEQAEVSLVDGRVLGAHGYTVACVVRSAAERRARVPGSAARPARTPGRGTSTTSRGTGRSNDARTRSCPRDTPRWPAPRIHARSRSRPAAAAH